MSEPLLDAHQIMTGLKQVGRKLERKGVVADLYIFGGAALAVAYNSRLATRDVNAVFAPDTEVLEAAWEVARENGWPRSWLNNQASSYLSRRGDPSPRLILSEPGIRVMAASPEHILAMKILASRQSRDLEDLKLLVSFLGLKSAAEALAVLHSVYPEAEVTDRARLLLEDVVAEISGGWQPTTDPGVDAT